MATSTTWPVPPIGAALDAVAVHEREQHPDHRVQGREGVAEAQVGAHRRPAGKAVDVAQSAEAFAHGREPGLGGAGGPVWP